MNTAVKNVVIDGLGGGHYLHENDFRKTRCTLAGVSPSLTIAKYMYTIHTGHKTVSIDVLPSETRGFVKYRTHVSDH